MKSNEKYLGVTGPLMGISDQIYAAYAGGRDEKWQKWLADMGQYILHFGTILLWGYYADCPHFKIAHYITGE